MLEPMAFPGCTVMNGETWVNPGMTLRAYMAIHAPQKEVDFLLGETSNDPMAARWLWADRMMALREKKHADRTTAVEAGS